MSIPWKAPGSHEARAFGCKCNGPRNRYGAGAFTNSKGVQYEIDRSCKLHEENQRAA